MARTKTARTGRPARPASEALVRYGLRFAKDKKAKLLRLKDFHGMTVREWIEGQIEREFVKMNKKGARV